VLTAYRRNYPNSQYQREVTRNLAVAYNETGRSGEAATEFEKISLDTREEPAVRREALLSAVDAFEKTGNDGKTSGLLERFVGEYPRPVGEAIEARQKLADFAAKRNDEPKLTFWRREIIKADASAGAERNDRSKTLAARAQLALAEPARDAFNRIRLTLPLKKSLDAKRKSLDAAIMGYRAAADYRVGEVSSAASFQIAELYRRLAKDLLASERPKKLDKDSLEQYNLLLEEQAFPFEEQSIELHEVNAARAREGWYDAGVRSSFGALAELKPARFGKTEVGIKPGLEPTVDPAEAEKSARAAIVSNAQDANAWVALGVSLRQQGKFAAAQEAYDRAILADPTNFAAHRNLGVLLDLYLDQPIPALASFERYKELSGEDKPVSGWIAELRLRVAKLQPPAPTAPAEGSSSVDGTAPPAGSANSAAPSANTPPSQEAA
jgi:tetratricopeptide (TPR) repeat protein